MAANAPGARSTQPARPAGPGSRPGPEGRGRRPGGPVPAAAAALPLVAVGLVIAWWGWKSGAYFRPTFLPGAMVLLGVLAALLLYAPWPGVLRGPAKAALLALLGLAGWTLLSGLWSPIPDVAVADAIRALVYAVAFGLGIWLCLLLGRRMLLALAPLAFGCALVAVATLFALWTGDDPAELLEVDATLRFPLGYRNAEAAFFVAGLFPMVVLAASRELDWRLRGLLTGSGTLAVELAVLSQSRGSAFTVLVGVALLVALHPQRLRALVWLAFSLVPAAVALPWLLDVFQGEGGNTAASLPPLRSACAAMAVTSVFAGTAGALLARADPEIETPERLRRPLGRALAAGAGIVALVAAIALVQAEGGPTGFISRHIDELTAGTPDLSSQGSRFGLDLRSNRGDLWRVAIDDFEADPIAGGGAGAFRFSYLRDRDGPGPQPEDPHSVELLMASELGLPGLLLFCAFIVGAASAALWARRLGPSAAALAAGSLAAAGYWLAHASVEWFWSYPALTMPAVFALGAAVAPGLLSPPGPPEPRRRRALAACCAVAALAMVPPLVSERYTNGALDGWRSDLEGAYSDLSTAADLNPLGERALVSEAVIAESAGEPQRALAALAEAQERVPDAWEPYYLEARILAPFDPRGALRALDEASARNPQSPEVAELRAQLAEP